MGKISHLFTDVIVVLIVILILFLVIKNQSKDTDHRNEIGTEVDSMFTFIKKRDSIYAHFAQQKDTITIIRDKIITTNETKRISELKKELEYWKGKYNAIEHTPNKIQDPLELYLYFDNIIKSKQ